MQAIGYADAECLSRTVPEEVSETASGRFTDPVTILEVTLAPAPTDGGMGAGVDLDGDGFRTPEDCNDADPLIKPGAQEVCRNRQDNDCDSLVDCADATCEGQVCGGPMSGGSCCAAGVCREDACGDLEDNDNDGLVDCLDSDCPMGSSCSDLDACTAPDTCGADGSCVPGTGLTCMSPPMCFASNGWCWPDAGVCAYPKLKEGATCDDGRACTRGDTCDGDGGCVGVFRCDTPPNACFEARGRCNEADGGGCDDVPLPTGPSSDGDNCTVNETCDGDGGCTGTRVTCTPAQCQLHAGCTEGGACLFTVNAGAACDAGTGPMGVGTDAGTCVVPSSTIFSFTPSTFTEVQLPMSAGNRTIDSAATLDTGADGSSSLVWTGASVGTPPAFTEVTIGALSGVLVFFDSLDVTSSGSLVVTGERPLLIAVRNSATVAGKVDVGSSSTRTGPGSNRDCIGGRAAGAGAETAGIRPALWAVAARAVAQCS